MQDFVKRTIHYVAAALLMHKCLILKGRFYAMYFLLPQVFA